MQNEFILDHQFTSDQEKNMIASNYVKKLILNVDNFSKKKIKDELIKLNNFLKN